MNKFRQTFILTALAGVISTLPMSAGERRSPDREPKGSVPAEPVTNRYPLLNRVIQLESPANFFPKNILSESPVKRMNVPMRRSAAPVKMIGNVVYAGSWDSRYSGYGLYEINVAGSNISTEIKLKGTDSEPCSNGGGVLVEDKFFSTYWYEGWGMLVLDLTVYDTTTWESLGTSWLEPYEGEIGYIASDMAYDAVGKTIYGCFYNNKGTGYEIATIKYEPYQDEYYGTTAYDAYKTTLGPISNRVVALGVTSGGRLYGVEEDGCLYEFDNKTGKERLIGDTGIKIASSQGIRPQSGAIDQHNDIFYWASVDLNGNSVLYTVDLDDAHLEKVGDLPDQERIYGLSILPHDAADGAPASLSDFAVAFEGASLSGNVSFVLPSTTFDGSSTDGDLEWHVLVNGIEKASGTAAPGTAVSTPVTSDGGATHIEAYSENSIGKSPFSTFDLWTGEDYPVMRKAEFTYVNNLATVSWAIEELGAHQGVVSDVTYDVVRMPGEVKVAEAIAETSFSETLTDEMPLGNYYYVITPSNCGLTGEAMSTSGKVIIGKSIIPPYLETFDTPESLDLYTIIGKDWSWNTRTSSSDNGVVNCTNGGSWGDDDESDGPTGNFSDRSSSWLITPEIKVEAGKTYEVRLKSWAVFGDKFEIWYGPGLDPAKYSILMPATSGFDDSSYSDEHVLQLKAEKTENIHLGFVHAGMFDSFLRLDDISISAGIGASSPAAVADLEVSPLFPGSKSVNISFIAPDKDVLGSSLNSLDKIDILVGNDIVKTFDNPVPGEKYSYTFTAAKNDYHQIRVEAYKDGSKSEVAEKKIFIGIDTPKAPTAWIEDKIDYIEVKWNVDATGKNGEYIDPDGVFYALFQIDAAGYIDIENPVAEGLQGNSVAFDFDTNVGEQGFLRLVICAYNEVGVSDLRYTSALLVGEPYDVPFTDGFDENSEHAWLASSNSDTFGVSKSHFSDNDGCSWGWGILQDDPTSDLESGKIATGGDRNLRVSFDYIANGGNTIKVYALYPDGTEALVGIADETSTGSNDDWKSASFEIPDSDGDSYIRLRFTFCNNAGYGYFMHIDNIHCDVATDHDISVEGSLVKGMAQVGETMVVSARVRNLGMQTADDVKVNLYVNGKLAESKEVSTLVPQDYEILYFNYLLTPSDIGKVRFTLESVYAPDEREDNNELDLLLYVSEPTAPAPKNLSGENTGNGVQLSWEAPEEFTVETVVEDFESYEAFSVNDLGEWTLVDADGRQTMTLSGLSYPNNGSKFAFMVFNPKMVVLPDETVGLPEGNTEAYPYDGNQYLISVATVLDRPEDHNDDWLISPELSGNAQTVSFFAKQMIDYYGAESCEVLYSTTNSTDIADFKLLQSYEINNPVVWTEMRADLPEGAKRFAIRVTTARGHMFMLDHITYEKGTTRVVTGYNIYRDEQKIANVAYNELSYLDNQAEEGHSYAVTALFANGEESAYSNIFVAVAGIEDIEADKDYTVVGVNGIVYQYRGSDIKNLPRGFYIINGKRMYVK